MNTQKEAYAENFKNYVGHKRRRSGDNIEGIADTFQGQWSDSGEEEYDENDASNQQGSHEDDDGDDESEDDCSEDYEYENEEGSGSADGDATSSSDDEPDDNSLLRHARKVYTQDSFHIFEHEYRKSQALFSEVIHHDYDNIRGLVIKYKPRRPFHYSTPYNVTATYIRSTAECSCNFFPMVGILCSHALNVFQCMEVKKIPDHYLLKWRMKSNGGSGSLHELSLLRRRRSHRSSDDCLRVSLCTGSIDRTVPEDGGLSNFDYVVPPILRHAKSVYSSSIYNIFKEEYMKSEYQFIHLVNEIMDQRGIVAKCIVFEPGHNRNFEVHAEATNGTVNCSCKNFDLSGILCSHALTVLDYLCIVRIPPQYIPPGFMKSKDILCQEKIHGTHFGEFEKYTRFRLLSSQYGTLLRMADSCDQMNLLANLTAKMSEDFSTKLKCLSKDIKMEDFPIATKEKVVKGLTKFFDDQLIKNFTYKKPETTRTPLFPVFPSSAKINRRHGATT